MTTLVNSLKTHLKIEWQWENFAHTRSSNQLLRINLIVCYQSLLVRWWQAACNLISLQWRHNEHDGVSTHRLLYCLLNRVFRRRSNKTSKPALLGFVWGIHRWPVNSPYKGPVSRKMFQFDVVIMRIKRYRQNSYKWIWLYKSMFGVFFKIKFNTVIVIKLENVLSQI